MEIPALKLRQSGSFLPPAQRHPPLTTRRVGVPLADGNVVSVRYGGIGPHRHPQQPATRSFIQNLCRDTAHLAGPSPGPRSNSFSAEHQQPPWKSAATPGEAHDDRSKEATGPAPDAVVRYEYPLPLPPLQANFNQYQPQPAIQPSPRVTPALAMNQKV